jgi:uncharacterized protein (TIGR00255 family)
MTAIASMTGFARADGKAGPVAWVWELRSVNGRGLDLRFRLPPGFDTIEPALREAATARLRRGNVTATLTVRRQDNTSFSVDRQALDQALQLALDIASRIPGAPVPRAEALLALPGVVRAAAEEPEGMAAEIAAPIRQGFEQALAALVATRRAEGARLSQVLAGILAEMGTLREAAGSQAADQPAAQRARMLENLQNLLRESPSLPEERIAQEVALLAVRSDVREELDRLASHIEAAHALLAQGNVIGRQFDFLVQEFVREANTLCSKSASVELTGTGLRLKAVIEQLREQVQNIE